MTLAASASLRALPLRRLLVVIVFVFVLLPLLVYNVAITLDYDVNAASSSTFFRGAVKAKAGEPFYQQQQQREPLPRCLNVSSTAFLSIEGLAQVQTECGVANASSAAVPLLKSDGKAEEEEEGQIVHFVHVPLDAVPLLEGEQAPEKETVTFLQFAAVQSVRKLVNPLVMVLHYVDKEPRGVWYTQCQRHLSLHKVLAPKIAAKAITTGREAAKPKHQRASSLNIYQRRQLMEFLIMLRVLQKQGGIAFSDFNTFVLRDTLQRGMTKSSLGQRVVIASQASTRNHGGTEDKDDGVFRVGVHTLQAPANHQFLKYLEHELLALIAKDDPKLRKLPLEELVGQLTLAKYKQEHAVKTTADKEEQQPAATTPATAAATEEAVMQDVVVGSSLLFEGIPQHRIPSLLSAQVGKDAAQVNFRGVSAFHLDKYDFQLKRNDTESLKTIQSLQRKILAAEDILEDEDKEPRSLFNALLRFAVGLNATAELDPHFD